MRRHHGKRRTAGSSAARRAAADSFSWRVLGSCWDLLRILTGEAERRGVDAVTQAARLGTVVENMTQVRTMPRLRSVWVRTRSPASGNQKLGQPEPESYLCSESKSLAPHTMQLYVPCSLLYVYGPVKARSVPLSCVTWYCSGVRRSRRSESEGLVFPIDSLHLGRQPARKQECNYVRGLAPAPSDSSSRFNRRT